MPVQWPKDPMRDPARIERKTSRVFMPSSFPAMEPRILPLPRTGTITISTMAKNQRPVTQVYLVISSCVFFRKIGKQGAEVGNTVCQIKVQGHEKAGLNIDQDN